MTCRCHSTGHDPGCPYYPPTVLWYDHEGKQVPTAGIEIRIVTQPVGSDRDMIRWICQTIHQAYHQDQPGVWETCPRDVCKSAKRHLEG